MVKATFAGSKWDQSEYESLSIFIKIFFHAARKAIKVEPGEC